MTRMEWTDWTEWTEWTELPWESGRFTLFASFVMLKTEGKTDDTT